MKKIIKKIMPGYFVYLLKSLRLGKAYRIDKKRFLKSAFNLVKTRNQENLEAKIIFHYHSLEKGLSNVAFREGFGEYAYTELIKTLKQYVDNGYDRNNIAFQTGLSVLNEYVIKHQSSQFNTNFIEKSIKEITDTPSDSNLGGVFVLKKENIIKKSKSNFEDLALNRFSVRDYSPNPVKIDLINQALNIAKKTPSVCNRQPWHTYVIRNKKLINDSLAIQSGFRGHGKNLDTLILVTSNNNFLYDYQERNQGFIDSGMYSMSLIYSLQYLGLATCAMNTNMTFEKDRNLRELLKIPNNQNLIMFIAIGTYEDEFKVPKSSRDIIEKKTTYYL